MPIGQIESYRIESETEAEDFLNDLLARTEYRSEAEIRQRAQDLISDATLRTYFVTRGIQILKISGNDDVSWPDLTPEQAKFLQALSAGEKVVGGNYDHRQLKPLIEMGYATDQSVNMSDIIYTITDKGRSAAQSL